MKEFKLIAFSGGKVATLIGCIGIALSYKRWLPWSIMSILYILLALLIGAGITLYCKNYKLLKRVAQEKCNEVVFALLSALLLGAGSYYIYTALPGYRLKGIWLYVVFVCVTFGIMVLWNANKFTTDKKQVRIYTIAALGMVVLNECMYYFPVNGKRPASYVGYCFLAAIGLFYILFMYDAKWLQAWKKKHETLSGWGMFAIAIFLSFATLEAMSGNVVFMILPQHWVMNMLWFFLVAGIIYLIFKSKKGALFGALGLMTFIGCANGFIVLFRGSPILPADLYLIQTAMEVSGNYSFQLPYYMYLGIAVMIATIFYILRIPEQTVTKKSHWRFASVYLAVLVLAIPCFKMNANLLKNSIDLWRPVKTYRQYGTLNGFGINFLAMQVEKPEGYSEEKVNEILSKYESDSVRTEKLPNIITVMCEAFSDLSVVGDFETNEEVLPYLNELKKQTIHGTAYASVCGGTTANSEFEFLTGNATTFLPAGTVPYQQYIGGQTFSLVSTLKSLGYSETALHSYSRNTYRRELVYPMLGFDEYLAEDSFENPKYLRDFISDESDFEKVIELFENRNKEQPFFLFNVTMQNHSSYNSKKMDYNITLTDTDQYEDAEEYLSCVNHTDQALKLLIDYFSKVEEPTYIIFYGDHQPNLDSGFFDHLLGGDMASLETEQLQKRYQVPFFIWSNEGVEAKDLGGVSTNFLSSIFLKEAKMPMTAYNKYLLDLQEKYPVVNINGYIDKDGNYFDANETRKNKELLEYNMLVYHSIINNSKGVEWAYQLKQE